MATDANIKLDPNKYYSVSDVNYKLSEDKISVEFTVDVAGNLFNLGQYIKVSSDKLDAPYNMRVVSVCPYPFFINAPEETKYRYILELKLTYFK